MAAAHLETVRQRRELQLNHTCDNLFQWLISPVLPTWKLQVSHRPQTSKAHSPHLPRPPAKSYQQHNRRDTPHYKTAMACSACATIRIDILQLSIDPQAMEASLLRMQMMQLGTRDPLHAWGHKTRGNPVLSEDWVVANSAHFCVTNLLDGCFAGCLLLLRATFMHSTLKAVNQKRLAACKVPGTQNVSDVLTSR
eukprot:5863664-Amphidinium_carterae.1